MHNFDQSKFRVAATLRNGLEVSIRSIRPDDRERLARAFRGLDRETVYLRLFRYLSEPTEEQLRRATEPDPDRETALVATTARGEEESIIAGGRYIAGSPESAERVAEVAFTVEEDYQGLGIAGLLLRHLGDIASRQGICAFEADVLSGNASMLRVFARSGLPMEQRRDGGVIHVRLSLTGRR
ncbi:MAG TPA: GNAT family N-acetyltransferase [Casimicrobiaceae bacterium]|nr:GNAT family N-acetyltransferase [Casimicrobiaceae bacterium]